MNPSHDGIDFREQLADLEELIGSELPKEYRKYLLQDGGSLASPVIIEFLGIDGHKNSAVVRSMFGLSTSGAGNVKTNYVFYVESGRIEKGYIPIAEDVGGNVICIGINAGSHGRVFFWDHELECTNAVGNLAFVCDSLDEFFAARAAEH